MNVPLKPIYLFADSQLLFWKPNGVLFLESLRRVIDAERPRAAYIGASNDDNPDFYAIFEAAMDGIGISDCRMIPSTGSAEHESLIGEADLILLAGGDVKRGWDVMCQQGLQEAVVRRYYEGALLIGISAGAIQLGLYGYVEGVLAFDHLFDTFKLVPLIISVHDEGKEWESLKTAVQLLSGAVPGIGIPTGGGMIYHPDGSIEPLRHPLWEFSLKGDSVTQSLLFPGAAEGVEE